MWILTVLACSTQPTLPAQVVDGPIHSEPAADDVLRARAAGVLGALPLNAATPERPIDAARVDLGRMLYWDKRLSKDDTVACNDCHLLDRYGVDGAPTSTGVGGQKGGRNAPTVYNAALHTTQFWDGREPDVEAQAKGPVLNPIEMAMPSADAVVAKLGAIDGYKSAFAAAFPCESSLSYDHLGVAIGAFERTLLTPGPFDAWLAGDAAALTPPQKEGLATFLDTGCATCHEGPVLGGRMFQKMGLVRPYDDPDNGREQATGQAADRQVFKVPSLRNIAETAPYFHNGSVGQLSDAIRLMGSHQLGKDLSAQDVGRIEAFLSSLTGPLPPRELTPPTLP
jgi:cytochrome c peroxidase